MNTPRPGNTHLPQIRPIRPGLPGVPNQQPLVATPMKQGFLSKVKSFLTLHKKKVLFTGLAGVLVLVAVMLHKKRKAKKKRSLAGIKAARTRARNRSKLKPTVSATRNTRIRKRKSPAQLKGRTPTTRKRSAPVRRKRATSNASRLKRMHAKAKQLQKQNPRTKYSTLLKRAAKQI